MCEKVLAKLKEYGVEGIDEMTLDEDPNNEGMNCGHAFLDFVVHNDAVKAFKRLSKPDAVFGCDRSARIAWAEASDEPDETVLARVGQNLTNIILLEIVVILLMYYSLEPHMFLFFRSSPSLLRVCPLIGMRQN